MNPKVLVAGGAVVLPLVAILFIGLGRDPHVVRSPLVGRPAPAFALRPLDGGPAITLESFKGRPVIVNFWASWCGPCAEEHELMVATARARRDEVQFLGIVYEDEEDAAREYLRRHGSSYPSLFDESGKTAIAYGVFGVPETFFISPDGTIVEKHVGALHPAAMSENLSKARGGAAQ
jgi:cytochrome c biogenesis protein CcmG/thiol:disulfide interchange protein DsbE